MQQADLLAFDQVRQHDAQDWDITMAGGKSKPTPAPKRGRRRGRKR